MVVLATKVYVEGAARDRALSALDSMVASLIGDLAVSWETGLRHDEFPTVTVSGEDAEVARNALRDEWGEVTSTHRAGAVSIGTFDSWDDEGFVLDAGDSIRVPAAEIGLGQGTPSQIRERFGLVQHLRLRFVAGDPPDGQPARLADIERDRLFEWTRGPGRVNVNSATRSEVRATVNRAGHADDIVAVERLGLLEQSVVCAEGTDPPGLLAAIGDYLPAELLCVIP